METCRFVESLPYRHFRRVLLYRVCETFDDDDNARFNVHLFSEIRWIYAGARVILKSVKEGKIVKVNLKGLRSFFLLNS